MRNQKDALSNKIDFRVMLKVTLVLFLIISPDLFVQAQSGRIRNPQDTNKNQSTQNQDDQDTLKLRTDEVLLPVSIRSSNGKVPTYLEKQDFIVTEDGKRQPITSVLRSPANVLFIIDMSGEVNFRKDSNVNREIALNMLDALGKEDQAAVISYADKIDLLSSWTTDKAAVSEALKMKLKPGIKSEYYKCLTYAAKEVLPKITGRRTVVLLSDGVDSFNGSGFADALAALHRARATVYVVNQNAIIIKELRERVFHKLAWYEMLDPKVRKRYELMRNYVKQLEAAEYTLKNMAEETGGLVWNSDKRIEYKKSGKPKPPGFIEEKDRPVLASMLAGKVVEEMGTEFLVAYSSDRKGNDKDFHPVKVFVTRPEIKVRARRGVYANVDKESGVRSQKSEGKQPLQQQYKSTK
jgi:VWFA-related protein